MTHVFFLVIVPLFLWKYFFLSINNIFLSTIEKLKTFFFYYSNVHFFLGDVFQIYFTIFPEILIKYEVIFLAMLWCSAHLQYTFLSFQWWNPLNQYTELIHALYAPNCIVPLNADQHCDLQTPPWSWWFRLVWKVFRLLIFLLFYHYLAHIRLWWTQDKNHFP